MTDNKENRIVTKDLNVWIGKNHILKDVNIGIPPRGITVILGPSGCGKTTLLKTFNRLIDLVDGVKVRGTVLLDGTDVYHNTQDIEGVRKKMGLLCQRPTPLPMSIYDNVIYGLWVHGERSRKALDRKAEIYLKKVGLWAEVHDRLTDPATKLSLGQQQRLCLARGLAVEPEVILCDEPTSALDPTSSRKIENMLRELKSVYTIVLVTHTLRLAELLADHVIFIYGGRVVEQGDADQVFNNPTKKLTKAFMVGEIS